MRLLETLGRMLLGAAIRRAMWRSPKALLIVAALVGFALLSIGEARAQQLPNTCAGVGTGCSRPQAYSMASQANRYVSICHTAPVDLEMSPIMEGLAPDGKSGWVFRDVRCQGVAWSRVFFDWNRDTCPVDQPFNPATGQCQQSCTGRPDVTVTRPPFSPAGMGSPSQFTQCSGGCPVTYQNMQDGTYVGVHTSNASCSTPGLPDTETCTQMGMQSGPWGCVAPPQQCTAGQVKDPVTGECKGSNCPAGMNVDAMGECKPDAPTCPPGHIKAPNGSCLPGEGMCAAGEARGKDGTCKRDSDGDGTPDVEGEGNENGEDEDGNSFSGGDNCNNPPACSGNPIMCGQARIQWRIECNTRTKVNITGGTCGAMPVCVGENCNLMEYAQLMQQWKTACTLEKMAQGTPTSGRDGLLDWAKDTRASDTEAANAIAAQGDGLEGISEADAWRKPQPNDGQGISETLFGSGSPAQCSISGGFDLRGHSIDPGPRFWWLMGWLGWLFPALAYLWLAQKLGG